jgi:PAS domain S-box-containing protein
MPAPRSTHLRGSATSADSRGRTTLFRGILAQSLILMVFAVFLLTLLSVLLTRSLLESQALLQAQEGGFSSDLLQLRMQEFIKTLLFIDLFLLSLTAVFARRLAKGLSAPLASLAGTMQRLRPGHWNFRRSVHTGDEVEALDAVAADLSHRLRLTYDHLEDEVAKRTQELKEEYLLDRTILERIEYGVCITDAAGKVTRVNRAAASMIGLQPHELLEKNVHEVLHFFQGLSALEGKRHPLTRALQAREVQRWHRDQHLALLQKDKTLLPVMLSVTPLMQGAHKRGAVAIMQDIQEEERVDEMKSEFITLASHQLRTPLSSLRWYLELLTDEDGQRLSREQSSYVEQMKDDAKRMAQLLEDLLHVAHLEGGKVVVQKRSFDLMTFLEGKSKEWETIAAQKKLTCTLSAPKMSLKITSDPVLLELVLQNLVTNAVKYSPEGTAVRVFLEKQRSHIRISVTDSGMGIPSEEQSHIFQKFFRAKNVRTTDTDGTGLGLYLAKSIVQNLGGRISFTSRPGKGTTFTVTLPLK